MKTKQKLDRSIQVLSNKVHHYWQPNYLEMHVFIILSLNTKLTVKFRLFVVIKSGITCSYGRIM